MKKNNLIKIDNGRKLFLVTVVAALTGCDSSPFSVRGVYSNADTQQVDSASHLYDQGKMAYQNYDMMLALKLFKASYAKEANSVKTLNGLASVYDHLQRYDLSQNYYYQALILDPASFATLNNLGFSYLKQNKAQIAVDYFRKANRLSPNNENIQRNYLVAIEKLEAQKPPIQLATILAEIDTQPSSILSQIGVIKISEKYQKLRTAPADNNALISAKRTVGYQLAFTRDQVENSSGSETGMTAQNTDNDQPILIASNYRAVQPPPRAAVTHLIPLLEVSNGCGRTGMAKRIKTHMKTLDVAVQRLTNADNFSHATSRIYYLAGWEDYARKLAAQLPISVSIEQTSEQIADIRLEVGGDLLAYDVNLMKQYGG